MMTFAGGSVSSSTERTFALVLRRRGNIRRKRIDISSDYCQLRKRERCNFQKTSGNIGALFSSSQSKLVLQ
jgi:hypothetical protein